MRRIDLERQFALVRAAGPIGLGRVVVVDTELPIGAIDLDTV